MRMTRGTGEALAELDEAEVHVESVWDARRGPLLFAFSNEDERKMFVTLISAPGVGPELAMKILASKTPAWLRRKLAKEDEWALAQIPGVGQRMAERLVVFLRDQAQEELAES
jgi:Holliday junction DNA helicase RuvA